MENENQTMDVEMSDETQWNEVGEKGRTRSKSPPKDKDKSEKALVIPGWTRDWRKTKRTLNQEIAEQVQYDKLVKPASKPTQFENCA